MLIAACASMPRICGQLGVGQPARPPCHRRRPCPAASPSFDGAASYRPASSRGKGYQRGPKRQWPIAIRRITATMMIGSNESSRTTAPAATCQVRGGSGKSGAVDRGPARQCPAMSVCLRRVIVLPHGPRAEEGEARAANDHQPPAHGEQAQERGGRGAGSAGGRGHCLHGKASAKALATRETAA